MRKTLLISSFCLATIALSSCSLSNITQEDPNDSSITKGLKLLRKGVELKGTLVQTRQFYTDDTFKDETTIEGESLVNESKLTFRFADDAFGRKIDTIIQEEEVPYVNEAYFKDEAGYAYTEYINFDNTVQKSYVSTGDGNKKTFAASGFTNPFNEIYEEDIIKSENGKYSLAKDKASSIFYRLLASYSTGMVNVCRSCDIEFNANDVISKITYEPQTRYVIDTNAQGDSNVYYTIEQKATFFVTSSGEEIVEHLSPIKNTSDNTDLELALSGYDGSNVTILYEDRDKTSTSSSVVKNYIHYLDGENVYYKQYQKDSYGNRDELDATYDYLLTKNPKLSTYEARGFDGQKWIPSNSTKFGKLNQDKYEFDDLITNLDKVSADLFTYNQERDLYVCDELACASVALKGLLPTASELRVNNVKYASSISIEVDDSSTISKIIVDYFNYNSFMGGSGVSGTVTIKLSDIGTTEIPFNALSNLGGNE